MNNAAIKMSNNDWRYLTFGLMGSGVVLRSCSHPWGQKGFDAGLCWLLTRLRQQNRTSCGWGYAALAPNSKLMLSSAALPQIGLQNPVADTAQSCCCSPPPPARGVGSHRFYQLFNFSLIHYFSSVKLEQRVVAATLQKTES